MNNDIFIILMIGAAPALAIVIGTLAARFIRNPFRSSPLRRTPCARPSKDTEEAIVRQLRRQLNTKAS